MLREIEPIDFPDGGWDGMLHVPASAHTLAGFRRWVHSREFPEKLRATYLDGEVYLDMSKENIQSHAAVKTGVCVPLGLLVDERDLGNLYINGVLVTNEEAELSTNPDAVLVTWESLEKQRVVYVSNSKGEEIEIAGSPDWLLEIVSDSSVEKDTHRLRKAYHRAGVREYWLIDARGGECCFVILYWRKSGYVAASSKEGWQFSRVFARHFRLTRHHDRRGAWKYTLHLKD